MTATQSEEMNKSAILLVLRAWLGSLVGIFRLQNLKWFAFYIYSIHLGYFGFTELFTGYISKGLRFFLYPWIAFFLYYRIHPDSQLLMFIIRLATLYFAGHWILHAIVTFFKTCTGTLDVTPHKHIYDEDVEWREMSHSFEGEISMAILAITLIYYQYLFLHYEDIPVAAAIVDGFKQLLNLIPHLGSV